MAIFISYNKLPSYYNLMPLIPLINGIMSLIALQNIGHRKTNVAAVLMFGVMSVRYAIIPFLMTYGGQFTLMKVHIDANAETGILLSIYECVAVNLAIIFAFKRIRINYDNIEVNAVFDSKMYKYVVLMFLFCVVMLASSPVLLDNYMTIFDLNQEEFTHAGRVDEAALGSVVRIMRSLYSVVFNVARILVPIYVVGACEKRISSNFFLFCIVMLFVFLQFMMITATFAESIVSALVVLLAVIKIRPSLGNRIVKLSPFAVAGIILTYFFVRYQVSQVSGHSQYMGNNTLEYICGTVSAYFTGIDNVAAALNLPKDEVFSHFISSLQITIPFNTTIFGKAGESLPALYNLSNGVLGQIPATVGNGYYYFGYLFAPIFSVLFAYYGIQFGIMSLATESYWRYICYSFIGIVLALGIGMYNEVIALGWINGWGMPMLFLVWLSERKAQSY